MLNLHEDKLSLSSQEIADSVCTNPSYVRQLMGLLRKAEIVHSVKGHPRPRLARSAAFITLFDVYRAIEGEKPLLHQDIHTNPNCGMRGEYSIYGGRLLSKNPAKSRAGNAKHKPC